MVPLAARLQVVDLNVDQQGIRRMESSTRMAAGCELACLCRALGMTAEEMLSDFYEDRPE